MKKMILVMGIAFLFSPLTTCFAAVHTVRLDWVASTTTGVAYDAFRGNGPGLEGTTPINSTPITGLTFTDAGAGDNNCYIVKARLGSGPTLVYSVPSNEVCVNYPVTPAPPGILTATPQ